MDTVTEVDAAEDNLKIESKPQFHVTNLTIVAKLSKIFQAFYFLK